VAPELASDLLQRVDGAFEIEAGVIVLSEHGTQAALELLLERRQPLRGDVDGEGVGNAELVPQELEKRGICRIQAAAGRGVIDVEKVADGNVAPRCTASSRYDPGGVARSRRLRFCRAARQGPL